MRRRCASCTPRSWTGAVGPCCPGGRRTRWRRSSAPNARGEAIARLAAPGSWMRPLGTSLRDALPGKGPGLAVHGFRLDGPAADGEHPHPHGRQGALPGRRLHRAALAIGEIRRASTCTAGDRIGGPCRPSDMARCRRPPAASRRSRRTAAGRGRPRRHDGHATRPRGSQSSLNTAKSRPRTGQHLTRGVRRRPARAWAAAWRPTQAITVGAMARRARAIGVGLHVGDRDLGPLPRVGPWPGERLGEGLDEDEARQTRITCMTSSPRWLMTLTAMRPLAGRGKGRETVRDRLSQASGSTSAFRAALICL